MIYSNVNIHDGSGNDIRAPAGRLDPDDPKVCLQQLGDIFRAIYEDESWKQLGKIGFTAVALDQNFSRIYNGYRDLTTYKYLVGDTDVNGVHVPLPWVAVCVGRQSVNDHQVYSRIAYFYLDLRPVYKCYNTHQLMYFEKNKKRSR